MHIILCHKYTCDPQTKILFGFLTLQKKAQSHKKKDGKKKTGKSSSRKKKNQPAPTGGGFWMHSDQSYLITTVEDWTLQMLAETLSMDVQTLMVANKDRHKGLTLTAKLQKGTDIFLYQDDEVNAASCLQHAFGEEPPKSRKRVVTPKAKHKSFVEDSSPALDEERQEHDLEDSAGKKQKNRTHKKKQSNVVSSKGGNPSPKKKRPDVVSSKDLYAGCAPSIAAAAAACVAAASFQLPLPPPPLPPSPLTRLHLVLTAGACCAVAASVTNMLIQAAFDSGCGLRNSRLQ